MNVGQLLFSVERAPSGAGVDKKSAFLKVLGQMGWGVFAFDLPSAPPTARRVGRATCSARSMFRLARGGKLMGDGGGGAVVFWRALKEAGNGVWPVGEGRGDDAPLPFPT